jgi:hypothetical protein
MRDLKRHLLFFSPGCDFYPLYLNLFVTYQDLKKDEKPYLKNTQAYVEADVMQMTVFLIT